MKKILLSAILLAAVTAVAQTPPADKPLRPSYASQFIEEGPRFQSCENTGGTGFFWMDTSNGELWKLTPPAMEWVFLGSPRGASPSLKGTYQLLSDRNGGVYILHTERGLGWWTDGTNWKAFGELSRRVKKTEAE